MNTIIQFLGSLYTTLIKGSFYHFGKNSVIQPVLNTSHAEYISVGDNVNIGAFCRITVSTEFAGVKCKSTNPVRLDIGNYVDVGNNSFISANNSIKIGEHVIMSAYVFITDHDHGVLDVTKNLHDQPLTDGGHVVIKDNVFLGVKCSILKNVTIGEHAVVAANAVVTKDVPAYSIVAGNPAKVIQQYDAKTKKWMKVKTV